MKHRVMLVEDDLTMRSLLQTLLNIEGFEVIEVPKVEHLEAVLGVAQIQKPDLILLDVGLRQFNGFDLLNRIRGDPNINETRVLMTSGMDFQARCSKEGADGFILKPYMPEELICQIREILGD